MLDSLRVNRCGFLIDSQRNEESVDRFVAAPGCFCETFSSRRQFDWTVRGCVDEALGLKTGDDPTDRYVADTEVDGKVADPAGSR